jgi:hypothetical protein
VTIPSCCGSCNRKTAINLQDYVSKLSEIMGFPYAKNSEKVVQYLSRHGKVEVAIKWAKELELSHAGNTPSQSYPFTRVYLLVERLLIYVKQEEQKQLL